MLNFHLYNITMAEKYDRMLKGVSILRIHYIITFRRNSMTLRRKMLKKGSFGPFLKG